LPPGTKHRDEIERRKRKEVFVSLLWIILIVILVLALLGFFSRGYW
jgi:hypothetical protein